ncbi:hypothetical protein GW17_00018794 [Ensete ventricosum]|nr:hypothetical protein GW17_00018794 [Ensete ventricosum]
MVPTHRLAEPEGVHPFPKTRAPFPRRSELKEVAVLRTISPAGDPEEGALKDQTKPYVSAASFLFQTRSSSASAYPWWVPWSGHRDHDASSHSEGLPFEGRREMVGAVMGRRELLAKEEITQRWDWVQPSTGFR